MSGLFGGGDKGAMEAANRQLEEQKKENARLMAQAEAERRDLGEEAAARRRARQRGGSRMLLSSARVNPEEGITTLGSVGNQGS